MLKQLKCPYFFELTYPAKSQATGLLLGIVPLASQASISSVGEIHKSRRLPALILGSLGYETDRLYLSGLIALGLEGAGPLSVDGHLKRFK